MPAMPGPVTQSTIAPWLPPSPRFVQKYSVELSIGWDLDHAYAASEGKAEGTGRWQSGQLQCMGSY